MWYKKEGGAVVKALTIDMIASMSIVQSDRQLVYSIDDFSLMLQSSVSISVQTIPVIENHQVSCVSCV